MNCGDLFTPRSNTRPSLSRDVLVTKEVGAVSSVWDTFCGRTLSLFRSTYFAHFSWRVSTPLNCSYAQVPPDLRTELTALFKTEGTFLLGQKRKETRIGGLQKIF